jgi:hypothetical protein
MALDPVILARMSRQAVRGPALETRGRPWKRRLLAASALVASLGVLAVVGILCWDHKLASQGVVMLIAIAVLLHWVLKLRQGWDEGGFLGSVYRHIAPDGTVLGGDESRGSWHIFRWLLMGAACALAFLLAARHGISFGPVR